MKKIAIAILTMLFAACSNKQSSMNHVNNDDINDSLMLVNQQDSVRREHIFDSKGDTIFAGVLYGMTRSEAEKNIRSFEKTLKPHFEWMDGFVFGTINFMPIYLCDFEKDKLGCPDPNRESYLFKGKLCSVVWHSYCQYAKKIEEIEEALDKFIQFFDNRYGKPNFKEMQSSNWYFESDGKYHFFNRNIAKWETSKRLVEIGIEWHKTPKTYYEYEDGFVFEYGIMVRFADKVKMSEIEAYKDNVTNVKQLKENERRRKDSLNSLNSL